MHFFLGSSRDFRSRLDSLGLPGSRKLRLRQELLRSCSGRLRSAFGKTKLFSVTLSPGCRICGQGRWSCLFLNGRCNADCFYCPQDRTLSKERVAFEHGGIRFSDPGAYADFLGRFGYAGVGFSGGEVLLAFERLVGYIERIREGLGRGMYLWAYTNGLLVDRDKLQRLKDAGLDELRFNISASGYDLKALALARKFMATVTVEIPAIPEDYRRLARILPVLDAIGVDYLNIHQLTATRYNYGRFLRRGYTLLSQPGIPVLESEIAALRILLLVLKRRLRLPVHYCSAAFQARFQSKGLRERYCPGLMESQEELTNAGYIRRCSLHGESRQILALAQKLRQGRCPAGSWSLDKAKKELRLVSALLAALRQTLDKSRCRLCISYFEPRLRRASRFLRAKGSFFLGEDRRMRLLLQKKEVARYPDVSSLGLAGFQELYLKRRRRALALRAWLRALPSLSVKNTGAVEQGLRFLRKAGRWEKVPEGL